MTLPHPHRLVHDLALLVGVLVGLWHMRLAAVAIFVFREHEPLSSWIGVATGLLATLPLVLLSIASPRWAGWGLIVAALASVAALAESLAWNDLSDYLHSMATTATGPTLVLGSVFLWVASRQKHDAAHPDAA